MKCGLGDRGHEVVLGVASSLGAMAVEHRDERVDLVRSRELERGAIEPRRQGPDVVHRPVVGAHDQGALHRDLRPIEREAPGELADAVPRRATRGQDHRDARIEDQPDRVANLRAECALIVEQRSIDVARQQARRRHASWRRRGADQGRGSPS